MAMPGYFIEVTFIDGSVVTTYATVIGEWYYFYSDKRYRFTRGRGTNVLLQQYQPIGTNMAWYDINIIKSVDVQQFDPSTAGSGATPEDVYTKEEVDTLIDNAVNQIMANIDEIVAEKVNEAISSGLGENYYTKQETDGRYVKKSGDTMTGQLVIAYGSAKAYYNPDGFDTYVDDELQFRLFNTGSGPKFEMHYQEFSVIMQPWYINVNNSGGTTEMSSNSFNVKKQDGKIVARMFNNNDSGAICVYDTSGNNNWVEPTQISDWVNGGTIQRTIVFGSNAVSFNTTVQVPSYESFLVSGEARYAGSYVNRYGTLFDLKFNDNECAEFRYSGNGQNNVLVFIDNSQGTYAAYGATNLSGRGGYTIGAYDRDINILGDHVLINSDSNATLKQKNTGSYVQVAEGIGLIAPTANPLNEIDVFDRIVNRTGRQYCSLAKYISICLSDNSTPSESVIELASLPDTLNALNYVINGIQDRVEELQVRTGTPQNCDYSKAIPVRILAGGGSTRGGGAGRHY